MQVQLLWTGQVAVKPLNKRTATIAERLSKFRVFKQCICPHGSVEVQLYLPVRVLHYYTKIAWS